MSQIHLLCRDPIELRLLVHYIATTAHYGASSVSYGALTVDYGASPTYYGSLAVHYVMSPLYMARQRRIKSRRRFIMPHRELLMLAHGRTRTQAPQEPNHNFHLMSFYRALKALLPRT